ncbi:DUF3015 family protein [Alteromonas sp. ASW11-19]|uniref:DUF3015 family protein n=1 Tax=Alteromonas salexigens TaxID=2982530 RepID=A0ABT2VNN4_9ALTE|nr:DUF3015 family protein [Alteromonas salexigens]MCU7554917.1 DUF3015 family protein [Alteromonas salexigens]
MADEFLYRALKLSKNLATKSKTYFVRYLGIFGFIKIKNNGENMKKVFLSAFATAVLMASTAPVMAAEDGQVEKLNPWKHCGIGAAIFDNNGTAAAISNIIWDLGTTALTTGTASEDMCNGERTKTAMFINENLDQLELELAVGEGQALEAVVAMTGGDVVSMRNALNSAVDGTRVEKAQAIYFSALNG